MGKMDRKRWETEKMGCDLKTAREGEKEIELKSSEMVLEGGGGGWGGWREERAKEPATGIV